MGQRAYVIELQHPDKGWEELFRSESEAEARRLWNGLPATGITSRARLLEVAEERTYEPTAPARA